MSNMSLFFLLLAVISKLLIHPSDATSKMMNPSTEEVASFTTRFLVSMDESTAECGPFKIDIRELTITTIQQHFRSGRLTSVELTKCYLNRISSMNDFLKAVIEINPEALALANRTDTERSSGINMGPLHGIPILIKDNIGTLDTMMTTAGAVALENLIPKQDSEVVSRLRKAGAVILGKTNLSEFAKDSEDIPNGWSGRGGQTRSGYALDQDPSGSSTGSAVSVSVNLAAISLGTETDGSIISPSSRNALVGLKPTVGTVSTRGVIPLSFSNDVVGPMARSVADAAILMSVISNIDLQGCNLDVSTCLPNSHFKIGVLRHSFWNMSDSLLKTTIPDLETCLANLKFSRLAVVVDPVMGPEQNMYKIDDQSAFVIMSHEFKFSLNNYLEYDVIHNEAELDRKIHSLADVITFNEINPSNEGYKQDSLIKSEATDGLDNVTYLATQYETRRNSIEYLESIFRLYGVDALATPCSSNDTQNLYSYGAFAGYPSITVPVGIDDLDMPFGLCLLGRPNSEAVLLKLGFFVELSRPIERPVPHFITSAYRHIS